MNLRGNGTRDLKDAEHLQHFASKERNRKLSWEPVEPWNKRTPGKQTRDCLC